MWLGNTCECVKFSHIDTVGSLARQSLSFVVQSVSVAQQNGWMCSAYSSTRSNRNASRPLDYKLWSFFYGDFRPTPYKHASVDYRGWW